MTNSLHAIKYKRKLAQQKIKIIFQWRLRQFSECLILPMIFIVKNKCDSSSSSYLFFFAYLYDSAKNYECLSRSLWSCEKQHTQKISFRVQRNWRSRDFYKCLQKKIKFSNKKKSNKREFVTLNLYMSVRSLIYALMLYTCELIFHVSFPSPSIMMTDCCQWECGKARNFSFRMK